MRHKLLYKGLSHKSQWGRFSLNVRSDIPQKGLLLRVVYTRGPRRDGLVVSVSASHAIGRGFAPRPGHTKDHHENG